MTFTPCDLGFRCSEVCLAAFRGDPCPRVKPSSVMAIMMAAYEDMIYGDQEQSLEAGRRLAHELKEMVE